MKVNNPIWTIDLEKLIIEVLTSDKFYGTLVQSDRFPEKKAYFKKRHFIQKYFAKIIGEEFYVLTGRKVTESMLVNSTFFGLLEKKLLEEPMTDKEVDLLIIEREQELLGSYQYALAHTDMPNTTHALLQSQAEEINSMQQGLMLDYRIMERDKTIF